MKQITKVRRVVCVMANQLKKAGYTLSEAFKKAWRRVKLTMTIRAAGTTFGNRQERLQFFKHHTGKGGGEQVRQQRHTDSRTHQAYFPQNSNRICAQRIGERTGESHGFRKTRGGIPGSDYRGIWLQRIARCAG